MNQLALAQMSKHRISIDHDCVKAYLVDMLSSLYSKGIYNVSVFLNIYKLFKFLK